jgi:hypothetical protein
MHGFKEKNRNDRCYDTVMKIFNQLIGGFRNSGSAVEVLYKKLILQKFQ